MAARAVRLDPSWKAALGDEFDQPYMSALRGFLQDEARRGKVTRPAHDEIFKALNATPLPEVRAVIIGQDPYHGPNQAEGLCFSVRQGIAIPPSLANVFREVEADMTDPSVPGGRPNGTLGKHGSLRGWARQGVLLLNAVLTTELGRAGAHRGRGWEQFTDRVVEVVDREQENVVFLLWGNDAQRKGAGVDRRRHAVLTAPHPSPLSAYRGFLGCRHFSRANHYLAKHGRPPIDWFRTD